MRGKRSIILIAAVLALSASLRAQSTLQLSALTTGVSLQSAFFRGGNSGLVAGDGGAIFRLWVGSPATSVELQPLSVTPTFGLYQSNPDPFNQLAQIRYTISYKEYVVFNIINFLGQDVATLVDDV